MAACSAFLVVVVSVLVCIELPRASKYIAPLRLSYTCYTTRMTIVCAEHSPSSLNRLYFQSPEKDLGIRWSREKLTVKQT